jgi:hypothetical protein
VQGLLRHSKIQTTLDLYTQEGSNGKRPEFPSGITSGARPTIQSWFIQRVWERRVARGDGDR